MTIGSQTVSAMTRILLEYQTKSPAGVPSGPPISRVQL